MPIKQNKITRRYNKYTKEWLEPIIMIATSWASVCRELGIAPATGAQTHIKSVAIRFNIDFSHFLGKSSNRGKTPFWMIQPIERYLNNEIRIKSSSLRIRLIKSGLKQNKCEICNLSQWLDEHIPLELDHIDSNHFNNNLSNLQIICPNCHATVTTKRRKERSLT